MSYALAHLREAIDIINKIDVDSIENTANVLAGVKEKSGRIFFLGVGGSAGNCSHAVNDFRKIVGIEAYAPTDNVSELSARTNDEGCPRRAHRAAAELPTRSPIRTGSRLLRRGRRASLQRP